MPARGDLTGSFSNKRMKRRIIARLRLSYESIQITIIKYKALLALHKLNNYYYPRGKSKWSNIS